MMMYIRFAAIIAVITLSEASLASALCSGAMIDIENSRYVSLMFANVSLYGWQAVCKVKIIMHRALNVGYKKKSRCRSKGRKSI